MNGKFTELLMTNVQQLDDSAREMSYGYAAGLLDIDCRHDWYSCSVDCWQRLLVG